MDDSEEVSRCGAMVSRPTKRSGRFQVLPPDVDIMVIMKIFLKLKIFQVTWPGSGGD